MLLRFGMENYRSFRDYTEVSFISTKLTDAPDWRLPAAGTPAGVLPVAGVYGANASGKSNLLSALKDLVWYVQHSFAGLPSVGEIPWTPWRLESGDRLTHLDVDFLVRGVRHHYGFCFNRERFVEEWLYQWPKGVRQVLFHRDHRQPAPWHFGRELHGARKLISEATRPNALFVSTGSHLNHEMLRGIAEFLTSFFKAEQHGRAARTGDTILLDRESPILEAENREMISRLIAVADTGIVDFTVQQQEPLEQVRGIRSAEPLYEVSFLHGEGRTGGWPLPSRFESLGTRTLLYRLQDLIGALKEPSLLIIDELDTSLHAMLCQEIISLFLNEKTNPQHSQLLFTTHDPSLLGSLRRDAVILVDKQRDGSSAIRAASDFKEIRGRDDLRRVYEHGRIGGVPIIGDFSAVFTRLIRHGS